MTAYSTPLGAQRGNRGRAGRLTLLPAAPSIQERMSPTSSSGSSASVTGNLARWILGSHREIVLVSRSPRRREILQRLGIAVRVAPISVDETPLEGEAPETTALRLAGLKSTGAWERGDRGLLLAADTVVSIGNELFGKPRDADDARRMLRALSGHAHRVVTALALVGPGGGRVEGTETTEVIFRDLREQEIDDYVATGEPFDKAGAYGIQGHGALLVRKIRGDYLNIVGLPMARLLELARGIDRPTTESGHV